MKNKSMYKNPVFLIHACSYIIYSVEVDDEDSWDFGTIKQAPPPQTKPSLQMQNSPSQYSVNSFTTEKYQTPSLSPAQQLPRSVSRNQINPLPHPSPASSRVNEVTVRIII
jgi:hypothetical protein